jgi:hypothetical protein
MKAVLPEALQDEFELVGDHHNQVVTIWGKITFSKLTKKHVESLMRQGYLGIRRKPQRAVPVAAPEPVAEPEVTAEAAETPARRRRNASPEEEKTEDGV